MHAYTPPNLALPFFTSTLFYQLLHYSINFYISLSSKLLHRMHRPFTVPLPFHDDPNSILSIFRCVAFASCFLSVFRCVSLLRVFFLSSATFLLLRAFSLSSAAFRLLRAFPVSSAAFH